MAMNLSVGRAERRSKRTSWAWIVATFFGIGNLDAGPGTWSSIATVLLWLLLATHSSHPVLLAITVTAGVTVIGISASTVVARESGIKDPGFVVIDEVAGQMLPLIIAP